MRLIVGEMTYRAVGEVTAHHPENVRRYMNGRTPSVEFIAALCEALDINANWLLTGRGPMRRADIKESSLSNASPSELASHLAVSLQAFEERLEEIESQLDEQGTRLDDLGTAREDAESSRPRR